jgi:hypothetical protein
MATPTEQIQQLYLAYYNRPGDVAGVNFWVNSLAAGASLASISKEFAKAPEYTANYGGKTPDAVIATIYQNLFNRLPDSTGLNYWSDLLSRKVLTIDNIVESVAASATQDPAKGADYVAVQSKVAAAIAFTDYLNTDVAARVAYSTGSANGIATQYLAGVTNDASLTAAKAGLATTAGAVIDGGAGVGGTFNLGSAVDTLPGTAANDTFNALTVNPTTGAAADTLGAFDSINGGAGKDTLNIYTDGTNNKTQAGTVQNVETINIYSTTTAFNGVDPISAAGFVGATSVNQFGLANDVTGLASTTTAGFSGVTLDANKTVTAASAATSASVALTGVKGQATTNDALLTVAGAKLNSVTVSGTVAQTTANTTAASLDLTINAAKNAATVSLNTAVKTTLHVVEEGTSTDHIKTLAAGASTGGITISGADAVSATLANITTGSGADKVTVTTVLSADSKAVAVATGAGKDTIVVNLDNTAAVAGTASVDAGDADDGIELTILTDVKYNVTGGAGNDTIEITTGSVIKTSDVIDGGAGTDTIAMDGSAAYIDGNYVALTDVVKNFEAVNFLTAIGTGTALDASRLAQYKDFILDAGGSVTKLAADQTVTTSAAATLQAAGYVAGETYAGKVNAVVDTGALLTPTVVTAKAADVVLSVEAGTGAGGVAGSLTGDVTSATVHLANGKTSAGVFTVATANVVTTNAGVAAELPTALGAMTKLTIDGNGTAIVNNGTGSALVTVDASGLDSVNEDGDAVVGLKYTSTNAKAETITLGDGIDTIVLSSSTNGKADTVTGLHLVTDAAGTTLTAGSDHLTVGAAGAFEKFTTAHTNLNLALTDAAASAIGDSLVFKFGADTYVFVDGGTAAGALDAADTVVKLTGTIDLDDLIVALATV